MKRIGDVCVVVLSCLLLVGEAGAQEPEAVEHLRDRVQQIRENIQEAVDLEPPDELERGLRALDEAAGAIGDRLEELEDRARETAGFLAEMHEFAGPCRELTPEEGLFGTEVAEEMEPPTPPHLPGGMRERAEEAFRGLEQAHDRLESVVDRQEPELAQRSRQHLRERVMEALRSTEDLLERRELVERRAEWLMRVRAKLPSLERDSPPCIFLLDALPRPGEYTLEELKDDPLLPIRDLVAARMRIHEFHADALRRGDWALGLGTIWTPLNRPEWEVVEGGGTRRVQRSDEENASGVPVAMLQFSPPSDLMFFRLHLRPYAEIGTSLDWDRPAFLFGGALRFAPFARAGVGYILGRVEMPAEGMGDGDILPVDASLRLRDEWEGDFYVSLTIGVGELLRYQRGE